MTLDGEQKFPHRLRSQWKAWEAFFCSLFVPCARGPWGVPRREEARDMAARAPIIASRFVWSGRSGISIGSGTRACFAVDPPNSHARSVFCLNHSRGSPGDRMVAIC